MEEPPAEMALAERVEYWRELAHRHERRNAELQREFDDYTAMSATLERELEAQLDQKERAARDARASCQRLERELDAARRRAERPLREAARLDAELAALRHERERHLAYARELEQKNDDLERAQRVVTESVAGIEQLLHAAYERNAALEGELDDMEALRARLQRATDEARDLEQELRAKERAAAAPPQSQPPNGNALREERSGANGVVESETQTSLAGTPLKGDITLNGNTMTPSSRISALNIVGDLLRKVGGLESKIASCRAPIHTTRESSHGSSEFNKDLYRMRRLSSRAPSSPAATPNFIH